MSSPVSMDDAIGRLLDQPLDPAHKALPPLDAPLTLGAVHAQGWHALDGDLPWPLMLLKEAALEHNLRLMAAFCRRNGLELAPHGKTTMAPQLVQRQIANGAWGVTAATPSQARLFHRFGVRRLLLANQLVDPVGAGWAVRAVATDPKLELYCLVDSVAGVQRLDRLVARASTAAILPVLLELGVKGQRAGCRTEDEALAVADAVAGSASLHLAGLEAFEGVIGSDREPETLAAVDGFLSQLVVVAEALMEAEAFASRDEVIVTVGGSAFPDRVATVLGPTWTPPQPTKRILRSGCYLTHDHGLYARASPFGEQAEADAGRLRPAIEVWGGVLSRPEPDLVIAGFGKRDVPYDAGMPRPIVIRDGAGRMRTPEPQLTVSGLNDQHAFVHVPADDALAVGDLIGCGISHPCTAFDKWSLVPLVDDDYRVTGAIRTFF